MSDGLPVPLSASKLKTFDRCPRAFDLNYIQQKQEEGGENHYIRRGNAVHEATEDVLAEGTVDLGDEDAVEFGLKRAYWDNGGQSGYDLTDEDDDFVLGCLSTAARFIASHDPSVVSVEAEVPFRSEQLQHAFSGYVDVVTETEVWDWKTGKSEGKNLDETLQGAVYMAGFYAHTGRIPEAIRFVYLKEEKVRTREPSDEMWGEVLQKAESLLRAVEFGEFPADPGESKCHWCDYEIHCDASPVGLGGVQWESYP